MTTGSRALILSDIGGVPLYDEAAGMIDHEQLEDKLRRLFLALARHKVAHDDFKLDNYCLVERDKSMVLDFDSSYIFEDEDKEFVANCGVEFISRLYRNCHYDNN